MFHCCSCSSVGSLGSLTHFGSKPCGNVIYHSSSHKTTFWGPGWPRASPWDVESLITWIRTVGRVQLFRPPWGIKRGLSVQFPNTKCPLHPPNQKSWEIGRIQQMTGQRHWWELHKHTELLSVSALCSWLKGRSGRAFKKTGELVTGDPS